MKLKFNIRRLHPTSSKYEVKYSNGMIFEFDTVDEAIKHTESYEG